jgi:phage shock protein A
MTSIFKRLNDIISANINDLIDRVEDPERMIKQIIREMEESINRAKEGVIDAIASEKRLQKDLEHHRSQSAEWLHKAEEALNAEQDALARMALTRKKAHDNILKALEPSWESAKATSEHLKAQLHALEAKLEEARRKRSSLVARQRAAEARQYMDSTLSHFQDGLTAHANFSRMEDRVTEIEARAEAMAEVTSSASKVEKEFLDMEVKWEVENELTALKKKVGKE